MFRTISRLSKNSKKNLLINWNRKYNEYSRNTLIDPAIGLTSDQRQLQSMAYQFAVNEFRPNMRQWDENEIFPIDKLRKAAQLGFGGLYTPAEDGGTGLSRLDTSVVIEALSQGCVSTTAFLSIHNMVCWMISTFANDTQKQQFLPNLVSMQQIGAYCLTEPNSGSDAASLQTIAKRNKDYYICKKFMFFYLNMKKKLI
jgi:isobutyryl-CoA dehydrogenase